MDIDQFNGNAETFKMGLGPTAVKEFPVDWATQPWFADADSYLGANP